jgi:uncharacterized protein (DUF342 family)
MSESEQQEPTIIEPMEATTALVDGLATCPSIDGLLTGGHAADLVMPGEYVIPSQAEPALDAGEGTEARDGALFAQRLGYLYVADNCARVVSPVYVSQDNSTAYLLCLRGLRPWPALQPQWIQAALQAAEVSHGVLLENIADLCTDLGTDPSFPEAPTVAAATPVQHGSDGRIDYCVDFDKRAGQLLDDGSIDLRERNSAVAVVTGQVVARVVGSTPGQDGCDVRGVAVPAAQGSDPELLPGENVRLKTAADGGRSLVAEIDGNLAVESETIHVRSVFTVAGDVDYDVGNIDVPGDVEIQGLVASGFSVKAGGTIPVTGTTEPGATLQAQGDVLVGQGILGEQTRVIAGGSVTTKFIQNSSVAAGADITVGCYIFNGRVRSGNGTVHVEDRGGGRGGSIVGGQVFAAVAIDIHRLGSAETDRTLLGIAANLEMQRKVKALRQAHQKLSTQVAGTQAALGITSPNDRDQLARLLARTPAQQLDQIEKQLKELRADLPRVGELQQSIEALEASNEQQLNGGRVRVRESVFSDVQIQIGSQIRQVTESISGDCEFYRIDNRAQWRTLST